jgi:hypothetical protein
MRLYVKQARPLSYVPKRICFALIFALSLQCLWHYSSTKLVINRQPLPAAPQASTIQLVSLDDSITAAKIIMLWLQAFDTQPGISIPLKDLDYDKVIEWLNLILKLDQHIQYPLFAAARFYGEVSDEQKQRKMIAYVSEKFLEKPNERWPFMTHAVYLAKHRVKDIELALQCAQLIRQFAKGNNVPYWAKQMEIFILEDMGELESAMVLIGGLLESGELKDKHQRKFLEQRLEEIKQRNNMQF